MFLYSKDILFIDKNPNKCLEDNGQGLLPDKDCIDCNHPPKQGCDDGYIMDAFPFNGCTKIRCLKPGNIQSCNLIQK